MNKELPRFYRAQERAFAPGIVKEWPKVWRMPRKVPHGRLVAVTVEEVIAELREHGYHITDPHDPQPMESPGAGVGDHPGGYPEV